MTTIVRGLVSSIRWYQRTLSPDHGILKARYPHGFCRYYPSCSEYTAQALTKYGLWGGFTRSVKRIARCTPFHKGGIDKP